MNDVLETASAALEIARGMTPHELVSSIAAIYLLAICVVGFFIGTEETWNLNLRLMGWVASGLLALVWLPVVAAARAAGRSVPLVGLGAISLLPRSAPRLRDPGQDSVVKVKNVNPVPRPRRQAGPEEWQVLGKVREGNSVGVVGGPGSAKNAAIADYSIRDALTSTDQHLMLVAPKAATVEIALSYARPEDRVFFYSYCPVDAQSSALDLFRDAERAGAVAGIITDDPSDQAHWREQAASCLEVLARVLPAAGEHPSLLRLLDILSRRDELVRWRRRSPLLDNIADEQKEWGYIRSGARKYLRPLLFRLGVRRVHAAAAKTLTPTYADNGPGRDVVIVRPRPGADEAEKRLVRAALDGEYRRACEAGDAGGPGVRVIVDEAASYMDLTMIPEYLELGRGSRTMLLYVLQSVRQLVSSLGRDEAMQLLASTDILCAGWTKDSETARMIEEASGQVTVHYSGPRQHGEVMGRVQSTQRPMILRSEVTGMPKGDFIVWDGDGIERVRVPRKRYFYLQKHPAPSARPHPESLAREESYAVPPIELLPDDACDSNTGLGDPEDII